jgi:MGT family glycosyltransferase
LPGWIADLNEAPTVCATLGTFMNRSAEVFDAILEALRDEQFNLVLTIGRDQDPAQFGVLPPNVHIGRYIPLSLLLPYCAAVVCQAGFSTVVTALNHGLPVVLIPLGADQPLVAQQMSMLVVGPVLGPTDRTVETIRGAVRLVLADRTYRDNVERVRDAMAALPGPAYGVTLLEKLVSDGTPMIARVDRS